MVTDGVNSSTAPQPASPGAENPFPSGPAEGPADRYQEAVQEWERRVEERGILFSEAPPVPPQTGTVGTPPASQATHGPQSPQAVNVPANGAPTAVPLGSAPVTVRANADRVNLGIYQSSYRTTNVRQNQIIVSDPNASASGQTTDVSMILRALTGLISGIAGSSGTR